MRFRLPKLPYRRILAWGFVAGVVLVTYVAGALLAWNSYRDRLTSGSFSYDGQIGFTGSDFLSPLDSDMAFSGSVTQQRALAASTQFLGSWGTHEYSGEAQITGGNLYFNLSGPQMPVIRYRQSSFLLPLQAGSWYSTALGESLYDNFCAHTQSSSLASKLEFYRAVRTIKLSPSPWVNFFATEGGYHVVHMSAGVSGAQLASLYQAATNAEPPGCNSFNTLGLSAEDIKHVSGHIDLFANPKHDELIVTLTDKTLGATARITLSTYKYNQPIMITPPAKSIDLNAIYASLPR